MAKFKDRVFGSNVDKKIIDIFDNLQKGSFQTEPLDEAQPTHQDYIGDRTPFARMWTALLVQSNPEDDGTYTSEEIKSYIVNDNREESYEPNEPIAGSSVFSELTDNPYLKPKAGITSINSKNEGALGAIKNTTVEFTVHNKNDFETIFLPFFLKPGSTVVVDYGWSDKNVDVYSVEDRLSNTDLELSQFKNYIFGENNDDGEVLTNGYLNDNLGLVETIVGRVVNYKASVNAQGSFQCSLELKSENTSLLDTEITDENRLKFLFTNKIEDIIIQLLTGGRGSVGTSEKKVGINTLATYDVFDAQAKKEALNEFYDSLAITNSLNSSSKGITKLIPDASVKAGLFYQNITDLKNIHNTDREVLYINYGLFEDLFLNSLVAQNSEKKKHSLNFNTEETFVRYDANLVRRQKSTLGSDEKLPLFLYPSSWQDTYNGKTPIGEYRNHKRILTGGVQYDNVYKTQIIPFRELFISVPLISETFSKKQNINDALESIIESINKDSYDVFKLKMIRLNNSFSSVSFQDANLIPIPPKEPKDILTFDVSSGNSIVSNLSYNFELPKGGLASMIAIGDKGDYSFFDDAARDNLNFLRILSETESSVNNEIFYKSLPSKPSKSESEKKEENILNQYNFSTRASKKIISQMDIKSDSAASYVNAVQNVLLRKTEIVVEDKKDLGFFAKGIDAGVQLYGIFSGNNSTVSTSGGLKQPKPKAVLSETLRDYYGKEAKINTVLGEDESDVASILPISIELTIYGNNYLNIGDIFLINFLPKLYLENVFFQIVGIDQKIGSTWETTYSTVMRLRPEKKSKVLSPIREKPVMDIKYTDEVSNKDGNAGENTKTYNGALIVDLSDDCPDGYLIHKASHRLDATIEKQKVISKGDPRALLTKFGLPSTRGDIAMVCAYQETIGEYIKKDYNKSIYITYDVTKKLKSDILFNPSGFMTDLSIGDGGNKRVLYAKSFI